MLRYVRAETADELLKRGLWALYERAFPRSERRSWEQHCRAMAQEDAFLCLMLEEDGQPVGLMFCWNLSECLFLEHFAVLEACRGRGVGREALRLLQKEARLILLEIEPPDCDFSRQRLAFYHSAGFNLLSNQHIQHPFHADTPPLPMPLLSWPREANPLEVAHFEEELAMRVMCYTDAPPACF